jgi:hypothetical protein
MHLLVRSLIFLTIGRIKLRAGDCAVRVVARLDDPVFDSRQGQEFYHLCKVSVPAVGLSKSPVHWVNGVSFSSGKAARG